MAEGYKPRKKKVCLMCTKQVTLDYKNPEVLKKFINEKGKMVPRRVTGTCALHQRDVSRTVYESIKPQIYPAITEEILDDRHVIKVEFSGENAPYSAYGRYYLRTADEDREVSPTELKKSLLLMNTRRNGKKLNLKF